jgi:hypothetical protein
VKIFQAKEIELKKRNNELKLESEKQDNEIKSIVENLNEVNNNSFVEEFDNKTSDLLLQDIYVKQAEKIVKNFDDTFKKLTFKASNEEPNSSNCRNYQ